MPNCDGCGDQVGAQHIRERIERLELATRFRPVHIQVLMIDAAPPAALADCFYYAAKDGGAPSQNAARYRREILQCAGVGLSSGQSAESLLADFQHRGFFLAHAVECPVEPSKLEDAVRKSSGTLVKRVQYSYRPKNIALLSVSTLSLIGALEQSGFSGCLILDQGRPFTDLESTGFREALHG